VDGGANEADGRDDRIDVGINSCVADAGRPADTGDIFVAHLTGPQAMPPNSSIHTATAELVIDKRDMDLDGRLDHLCSLTIDYADPVAEMIAADFFLAASRCEASGRLLRTVSLSATMVSVSLGNYLLSDADYQAVGHGGMYLVIRTTSFPTGELRGWFIPK
jgi:hypothetical protein